MANKKRLIDLSTIGVGARNPNVFIDRERALGWNDLLKILEKAPTVDAVEVVRCKDCIRRYDTDECPMCHVSGGQYCEYTSDDGYCYKGERKEDAAD